MSLLSGQPKDGIHIEARSETKGHYEATTSDSLGNYRLRGLLPDTTYVVRVVAGDDSGNIGIERASPKSTTIQVGYPILKPQLMFYVEHLFFIAAFGK